MATRASGYYYLCDSSAAESAQHPTDFCECCPPDGVSPGIRNRKRERMLPLNHPAVKLPPGALDPYATLLVRRDATAKEIKNSYRRLALLHHPKRQRGCLSQFTAVAAAYETLSCPATRLKVDAVLGKPTTTSTSDTTINTGTKQQTISWTTQVQDAQDDANNISTDSGLLEAPLPGCNNRDDDAACAYDTPSKNAVNSNHSMDKNTNHSGNQEHSSPNKGNSPNNDYVVPALVQPSSSGTTTNGDVRHYSEVATERLFGGPLQLMYRARRWQPFTDPYVVFHQVFGSSMGEGSSTVAPRIATVQPAVVQPAHAATNWSSQTEVLPDGTTIHTNSRVTHDHRSITRTVTRYQDRTTITVTANDPVEDEMDEFFANSGCWCGTMMCVEPEIATSFEKTTAKTSKLDNDEVDDHATAATEVDTDDDCWSFASSCQAWFPSCV